MENKKPENFQEALDLFNQRVSDPDYHLKLDISVNNDVPTYKFYVSAWPTTVTVYDKTQAFDVMNLFIVGYIAGAGTVNAIGQGSFNPSNDGSKQKPSLRQRLFGRK